jgi:lysozyme
MQHISQYGIEIIKEHEGLRLNAYRDPVGIWTIGYGHTRNVREGDRITESAAESFLMQDIARAEHCIRAFVRVPLTQGQFDALVSFIFNVGCGAFQTSTMLRHLNRGNHDLAAEQFPRWVNGGGKILRGLVRRREDERILFVRKEKPHEIA